MGDSNKELLKNNTTPGSNEFCNTLAPYIVAPTRLHSITIIDNMFNSLEYQSQW